MKEKTCLDLSDYLAKYIAKFCIGAFLVLLPCIWIGWSSVQVQHVAVLIGGFAGVLSFGVSLPEHDETDEFVDGPETVMQVIKGDPDLTIFRACVEDMKSRLGEYGAEAVGAILMLEGEDHEGITVFAPVDTAMSGEGFHALARGLRKGGGGGKAAWLSLLLSHISGDKHAPDTICTQSEVQAINGRRILLEQLREAVSEGVDGEGGEASQTGGVRAGGDARWRWPHVKVSLSLSLARANTHTHTHAHTHKRALTVSLSYRFGGQVRNGIVYKIGCVLTDGRFLKRQRPAEQHEDID
jgi:hypothetical protein